MTRWSPDGSHRLRRPRPGHRRGEDTALAGIQKLVTDAQNSSSRAQRLADRAAAWLFWFALGAAVVTAVVWALWAHPMTR